MIDFHYIAFAQEVIFGHLAVIRMDEALRHVGLKRLMLCSDEPMATGPHAPAIQQALEGQLAVIFDGVRPRLEDDQLGEVVELAELNDVDAVAGFGGDSAIGMAKAAAFHLEKRKTGQGERAPSPTSQPLFPCIAIPTSYAGSEMTSVFAVTRTHESRARKVTVYDPKIAPKLVVYDPQLTLDMPPDLTASSGIRALAHCFEALYSITRHPLSTAAALSGIDRISRSLPTCFREGSNLEARTGMLAGAYLAASSFSTVAMGLHHALCHVLDESDGVPHGISDSLILPHVIRFNAASTANELLPAAAAMGIPANGRAAAAVMEELAQRITQMGAEMELPQRLREVGIEQGDLRELAQLAFQDPTVQNNPRRIKEAGLIEALLNEAW
jgi:alcohol dehydrogenase class IV